MKKFRKNIIIVILLVLSFSLLVTFMLFECSIYSLLNPVINIGYFEIGSLENYNIGFVPNNENDLEEVNTYLLNNYVENYNGYYSNAGSLEGSIDNKLTQILMVNESNYYIDDDYINEGKNIPSNWSSYNNIPVLVGGARYEDKDIGDIINIMVHSDHRNINRNELDLKCEIVGRIATPYFGSDSREYNLENLFMQDEDGLIIIPDENSAIMLYEPYKEVWLSFSVDIYESKAEIREYISNYGELSNFNGSNNSIAMIYLDDINYERGVIIIICIILYLCIVLFIYAYYHDIEYKNKFFILFIAFIINLLLSTFGYIYIKSIMQGLLNSKIIYYGLIMQCVFMATLVFIIFVNKLNDRKLKYVEDIEYEKI